MTTKASQFIEKMRENKNIVIKRQLQIEVHMEVVRKSNTNPKEASKKNLQSATKLIGGPCDLLNEKGKYKEDGVRIIQYICVKL